MPHSEECREIFRGLMKNEAKVRNAEARKAEFEEKVRRKAEKKAKKDEGRGREEEKRRSSEVEGDKEEGAEGSRKVKEVKRPREDIGEDLLGNEEERRIHRRYVREESKRIEKEWRDEKKRRMEEEKGTRLGWSKPKQAEWQKPRAGEDGLYDKEGQMRADDFGKRTRNDVEVSEKRGREAGEGEELDITAEWEDLGDEDGGREGSWDR